MLSDRTAWREPWRDVLSRSCWVRLSVTSWTVWSGLIQHRNRWRCAPGSSCWPPTGLATRDNARRLGVTVQTVRCWRRRWGGEPDLALVDRLADAPRPETPPTITPEQICAILAVACEPPEASGIPITHWSQSALAREAVKRGLVETISHGSVGRSYSY